MAASHKAAGRDLLAMALRHAFMSPFLAVPSNIVSNMGEARIRSSKANEAPAIPDKLLELSSFTQNITALEAILGKMEAEIFGPAPSTDRLNIFQSEARSLLTELQAQQARAVALRGVDDANVQRLQRLLTVRLEAVVQKTDEIVRESVLKIEALDKEKAAIEAMSFPDVGGSSAVPLDASEQRVEEPRAQYMTTQRSSGPDSGAGPLPNASLGSAARILADSTKQLNKVIDAHPEIKDEALPILKQLVDLSIRAIMQQGAEGGAPPRGPVDTPPKRGDDGGMEPRVAALERFAEEARKDLRSIDVRLAKIEVAADGLARNSATKADIFQLESTLLKWFIGTAMTIAGLAFAAAKLLQ
ncbi:MAG: hypothetical protein ABWY13_06180 [Mesorhizobium sp.]